MTSTARSAPRTRDCDAVVVGAGFAGLYMLHRLRQLGLSTVVLERGGGIGGTWFWNRYPGARCDIESIDYCYSFSPELVEAWDWSERYPAQPEILRYIEFVADRLDLRRDVELETTVTAAHWDDDAGRWLVETDRGERISAQFCVMATGCLSSVKQPDLPGLREFEGRWLHTGRWPVEGVDFSGQRVGLIGTGSTGIQAAPRIAEQAERLFVFQRTPNYSMPARNRPLAPEELAQLKRGFVARRALARASEAGVATPPPELAALDVSPEERRRRYEEGWARGGLNALSAAFNDLFVSEQANATAQEFAREKVRELVHDPALAELLCARHHIGTKRTCVDTGYFEIYNRDDVELVDVRRAPIERVTPRGLRTSEAEYALDAIVFAIGFDAITGTLLRIDVRGRDGVELREHWAAGPRTYLGLGVAGFPNLFLVTGPGSPSVLSNMLVSIEQHVEWIADVVGHLRECGVERIEATAEAEARWVAHVNELADATLYPQATSWYLGANIPGKPRVFMPYVGGCGRFRAECDAVVADGYRGFALDETTTVRATVGQGGRA